MNAPDTTTDTSADGPEVARYGLRTFAIDLDAARITPLLAPRVATGTAVGYRGLAVDPGAWTDGACVAVCAAGFDHDVPDPDCGCGIYATTNLLGLHQQYPSYAHTLVAVIAAEDTTIIGAAGMRTEAARVVAYWLNPHTPEEKTAVVTAALPDARRFDDCDAMATAYRLPFTPPPSETHTPLTGFGMTVPPGGWRLGPCVSSGLDEPLFRGFAGPAMAGGLLALILSGLQRMGAAPATDSPASDAAWRWLSDMGAHVGSVMSWAGSTLGNVVVLTVAVLAAITTRVTTTRATAASSMAAVWLRTLGAALTAPSVFLLFYGAIADPEAHASKVAAVTGLVGPVMWLLGAWITRRGIRADDDGVVRGVTGIGRTRRLLNSAAIRPLPAPGADSDAFATHLGLTPDTPPPTPGSTTTSPDDPDSNSGGAATPTS